MMQEGMSSISKGRVEHRIKDVDGQQKKVIKGQLSGYPTLLRLVEVVAYAETGLSARAGNVRALRSCCGTDASVTSMLRQCSLLCSTRLYAALA